MRADRYNELKKNGSIMQLKAMKGVSLDMLDKLMFERSRCESSNPQYKNTGLNRAIIVEMKKISSIDSIIEHKEKEIQEKKEISKRFRPELSTPEGWHSIKKGLQ